MTTPEQLSNNPVVITRHDRVIKVTINRPKALNALNAEVSATILSSLESLDVDPDVGCILLGGSERAFAAGADIKELQAQNYRSMMVGNYFWEWDRFAALRTPKVAAVSGYALGGGCELAMMCDIILASPRARFGQPEIKLGLFPGMGGTQRLTRLVGRAKAMDLILTARMMDAEEAERSGLVSRIIGAEDFNAFEDQTMAVAQTIAGFSKHTAIGAVELVDRADQTTLAEGVLAERRGYYALFDTPDAREGMTAFVDKREPKFNVG